MIRFTFLPILLLCGLHSKVAARSALPFVINTWGFRSATESAWNILNNNQSAIDAVVAGCTTCEREQCDGTVGFGGSPDENGETTLDAMIMDGRTMNIGCVAALRNIREAIQVARHVMDHTRHTFLAGSQATEFALQMGFKSRSLVTPESAAVWNRWRKENDCQPNFWIDVTPDPTEECGPYQPRSENDITPAWSWNGTDYLKYKFGSGNHDTIGMIAIDQDSNISAGTSTNGARHKIPGRIGDSPIPGAGAYADNSVGAASATGDGDIMMRFLPSLLTVEFMRQRNTPTNAARMALRRIIPHYPNFVGAIVATTRNGIYGAACYGMASFPFSVYTAKDGLSVQSVTCITS